MSRIVDDLAAIVGAGNVIDDPVDVEGAVVDWTGRYRGTTPAVVAPADAAEVAEVLAWSRSRGVGVVPQGGNTGLVGGATPFGHVVLSTRRMTTLEPVDTDAGQVTAAAGVTIADLQAAATAAGWRYAVDLAARDSATVGGTIATNAGGIHVIGHGDTRRQLLGVEAVLGTGEVVSRLDGLVKDNTGYDLARLLCGSEGTLGVVTRARLALVAPPDEVTTALVSLESARAAVTAVGLLRRGVPGVEAVELMLADGVGLVASTLDVRVPVEIGEATILLEATGEAETLAAVIGSLPGVVDTSVAADTAGQAALWAIRELHTEAIARLGVPVKFDVTIPLAAMADFIADVRAQVTRSAPGLDCWIFGHAADGNVHVNVTGVDVDSPVSVRSIEDIVLGLVVAVGGSISAEHGIGRAKAAWLERNRSAGDVAAMRRIKAALDPAGILNPGVLF